MSSARCFTSQDSPALARLEALAALTDEPGCLTRLYLSPAHRQAAEQVRAWMADAGMAAAIDAVGNVVGRYEGEQPGLPALLLGSHIDTVRDAGRFDGALGVVAAIEAVAALGTRELRLPFAIEVLAFGDEEGVRFPTALCGSRAVAGTLDPAALEVRDGAGISIREALGAFGCEPAEIGAIARRREDVLGYVELHIEQGPVLEAESLPVGVVTAISGASRFRVEVKGVAGHAGTVPMALRKDALTAAAEMVLTIEAQARATEDLVATVGQIEVPSGAVNVVPGAARFTIDIRSPSDAVRTATIARLEGGFAVIAETRGVAVEAVRTYDAPAAACAPWLQDQLAAAVERAGVRPLRLPSGAGHDGLAMAALCPIGMLFLRCKGGISHNPAESITTEDADLAVRVLVDFLCNLVPPAGAH